MKMIFRLVLLIVGFLVGIFVGIHYPQQAAQIDQVRSEQQAKVQPQIEAAVAKAKVELLDRLLKQSAPAGTSGAPGSNFLGGGGGGTATIDMNQLQSELHQEQQHLATAENKLKSGK